MHSIDPTLHLAKHLGAFQYLFKFLFHLLPLLLELLQQLALLFLRDLLSLLVLTLQILVPFACSGLDVCALVLNNRVQFFLVALDLLRAYIDTEYSGAELLCRSSQRHGVSPTRR